MELPGNANPDEVTAAFRNGVLTINVDKAPEGRSRRVTVKTGE